MSGPDAALLDAIATPVIALDRDGRVVFWNAAHANLVGHHAAAVVGRDTRELLTATSGPALTSAIERLFADGQGITLDLEWKTRSGPIARQQLRIQLSTSVLAGRELVVATGEASPPAVDPESIRRVLDLAPTGILVLSRDGGLSFNSRAEQILGVRLSCQGGNAQYLHVIHRPDGTPLTLEELPSSRALDRGETLAAVELAVHRPDGTQATLLESARPVFEQDGSIARCVVVFEDITERRRIEVALRNSHAKLNGIVSLATDAIIATDDNQMIVLFNEGAEETFGWKADEIIGKPLEILIPERLRERHHELVAGFARDPASARRMHGFRPTVSGLRKSGEEFPAEAGISKVELDGATVMATVLRDISDRRREENRHRFLAHASAALASSLDPQETLTIVARLAVPLLADCCLVDLLEGEDEARVVRCLKAVHIDPTKAALAARLEAIEIRDPRTHPLWQALYEQRPILLRELSPSAPEGGAGEPEQLRQLRELQPVSLLAVPLVSRRRVLGALWFVSVQRDRLYGEGELRLSEDLARRAALAIDNSQLYMLSQRAIRVRDEMLGVVAHDLRNPLNSIRLSALLLGRRLDEGRPNTRALADRIASSTEQADLLIQDLLDVTSLDAGRLAVARVPCRPADLLNDALELVRPIAENAAVQLASQLDPDLPLIDADRHRILQVFSNLAGNAIKFTPKGGRIVLAAARREGAVCFSVADTGPGMPPEHLSQIFERFWQARPTDRRGAGLGLAIAKGIVEAHNGTIWVESTLGAGSTFFFSVPQYVEPILALE